MKTFIMDDEETRAICKSLNVNGSLRRWSKRMTHTFFFVSPNNRSTQGRFELLTDSAFWEATAWCEERYGPEGETFLRHTGLIGG